jgi:hypothetical protein
MPGFRYFEFRIKDFRWEIKNIAGNKSLYKKEAVPIFRNSLMDYYFINVFFNVLLLP